MPAHSKGSASQRPARIPVTTATPTGADPRGLLFLPPAPPPLSAPATILQRHEPESASRQPSRFRGRRIRPPATAGNGVHLRRSDAATLFALPHSSSSPQTADRRTKSAHANPSAVASAVIASCTRKGPSGVRRLFFATLTMLTPQFSGPVRGALIRPSPGYPSFGCLPHAPIS